MFANLCSLSKKKKLFRKTCRVSELGKNILLFKETGIYVQIIIIKKVFFKTFKFTKYLNKYYVQNDF